MPLVTGVQGNSPLALSFVESLSRVVAAKPAGVQATTSLSTLARALIAAGTIDAILKVTEAGSADTAPSRIPGHDRFDLEDPVVPNPVAGAAKRDVSPSPTTGVDAPPAESEPTALGGSQIADGESARQRLSPPGTSSAQGPSNQRGPADMQDLRPATGSATIETPGQIPASLPKAVTPDDTAQTTASSGADTRESDPLQTGADGPAGPGKPSAGVASSLYGQESPVLSKTMVADRAIAFVLQTDLGLGEADTSLTVADEHADPDEIVEPATVAMTDLQKPARTLSQGRMPAGTPEATIADGAVATVLTAVIGSGEPEILQTIAAPPGGSKTTAPNDLAVLQKPVTTAIQGQASADPAKAISPDGAIASIIKAELGHSEASSAPVTVEEHGAAGETVTSEVAVSPEPTGLESTPHGGAFHLPSFALNQTILASATTPFSAAIATSMASEARTHDAGAPAAQAYGPQASMINEALARDHAEFPFPLNRRTTKTAPARTATPIETCIRCKKPRRNARCACNTGFHFPPF